MNEMYKARKITKIRSSKSGNSYIFSREDDQYSYSIKKKQWNILFDFPVSYALNLSMYIRKNSISRIVKGKIVLINSVIFLKNEKPKEVVLYDKELLKQALVRMKKWILSETNNLTDPWTDSQQRIIKLLNFITQFKFIKISDTFEKMEKQIEKFGHQPNILFIISDDFRDNIKKIKGYTKANNFKGRIIIATPMCCVFVRAYTGFKIL